MENYDLDPTIVGEDHVNSKVDMLADMRGSAQVAMSSSPFSSEKLQMSLPTFLGGKDKKLHLTQDLSDSVEDHLYDTYGDSSLLELNPMLEKKKELLSPLKKRALMGDNNFPFTNNDITKNQDSDNSDEELQLHNIYKETAVMEENPMLEKRKIGASKLRDKSPSPCPSPMSVKLRDKSPSPCPSPMASPDRMLQKAFTNMFQSNASDANIPVENGNHLQKPLNDTNFDDMLYNVYEDRSVLECNPMITKRKSMSALSDSRADNSIHNLTYAHSNYSAFDGEGGRFSGVNPTHSRLPVSRPAKRIPPSNTDGEEDDEPENDDDWGEMLYSFYGSEALDEKSPRFFEKSKNMQKVLTKSRSAKQLRKGITARCTVLFDVSTAYEVSSNGTYLVLQPKSVPELFAPNSAKLALQPSPSLMVTERLTHTLTNCHQVAGKDGKIYEWIRGPTAQGWFVKLSKGGAGLSRPLKRYFVLRGRSLLCYRSEPVKAHSLALGASVVVADRKKNKGDGIDGELSVCLVLGPDATMQLEKEGSKSASSSLLVIKTEQKDFTLRLRGGKHASMEEVFIHQLKKAMQLAKAAAEESRTAKSRMESLWTHSNCNAVLAAVDVVVAEASPEDESVNSNSAKAVRFALVRIPAESDNVSMPPMKSKPAEDRSTSCPRQDADMEAGQSCYSLSVCVGENTDPVHLEVLTLKHCDAALFSSSMRCMAAMGDCVIMGGSEGFLAVGVLGKSQCTFQSHDRVLYCVPARESSAMFSHQIKAGQDKGAGFYPHNLDATVVSIAVSNSMQMYAAADDQGVVSFWHLGTPTADGRSSCEHWSRALDKSQKLTNVARCYKIRNQLLSSIRKKRKDESIRSIKFSPDDKHLVVTTSSRVVLLSLTLDTAKWALKVSGWSELVGATKRDREAVFSVDFVSGGSDVANVDTSGIVPDNSDRIVIWKVEDFPADNITSVGSLDSNSKSLYEKSRHGVSTATMDTDVDLESSPLDGNNEVTVPKKAFTAHISRTEWSSAMWKSAYQNIRHIV